MPYLKIQYNEPFPFIFLSRDYASDKYGTTVTDQASGTNASVVSGYPAENVIDGNRDSFCYFQDIGGKTSNAGILDFDLSNSIDREIDVILLETDVEYPIWEIEVRSYIDSGYSSGEVIHNFDKNNYVLSKYTHGVNPRVDIKNHSNYFTQSRPNSLDGRYIFLSLEDSIAIDHPYIRIFFYGSGRNYIGMDASFDYGIWDNEVSAPDGPTIITSDPNPSRLGSTNHYELDLNGKSADQTTQWIPCQLNDDQTYIFRYYNKMAGLGDPADFPYIVEIEYRDFEGTLISTEKMIKDLGLDLSWTERVLIINGLDTDGVRRSALTYGQSHDVPTNAAAFRIRFRIDRNPAFLNLIWKIDDICMYKYDIKAGFSYHNNIFNGTVKSWMDVRENSGKIKINRIGMFSLNFVLSKTADKSPQVYDLGGKVGPNPQSFSVRARGTTASRNADGRVIGLFTSGGGRKLTKVFGAPQTKDFKDEILKLSSNAYPIGIYETQGDWGEYIINQSSFNANALTGDFDNPEDYIYMCIFEAEEA